LPKERGLELFIIADLIFRRALHEDGIVLLVARVGKGAGLACTDSCCAMAEAATSSALTHPVNNAFVRIMI
jgi:hypothetical protein